MEVCFSMVFDASPLSRAPFRARSPSHADGGYKQRTNERKKKGGGEGIGEVATMTYPTTLAVWVSARRRFFVGGPFSFSLLVVVRIAPVPAPLPASLPSSTFFVRSLRLRGDLFCTSLSPRCGATGDAVSSFPRGSSAARRFREFAGASLPAVESPVIAVLVLARADLVVGLI